MKRAVLFLMVAGLLAAANGHAGDAVPAGAGGEGGAPPPAQREAVAPGRHSVSLDGGVFFPARNTIAGVGTIHDGYYADLRYVYKPNDMFSFASTVGVYGTNADSDTGQSNVYSVVTIPFKETVLLTIPIHNVELYGGGGVGYYLAHASINAATGTYDSTDGNVGYHFTSGAEVRITPRISLRAEAIWEYSWVHLTDANGADTRVNIGGTVVDAGVKFRF